MSSGAAPRSRVRMSSVLPMLSLALCLLLSPPVAGWNTAAQLSRGRTVSSSRSRPVFALADPAAKDAPADSSFDFGEEKELKPKTEAALSADEAELGKVHLHASVGPLRQDSAASASLHAHLLHDQSAKPSQAIAQRILPT
eukprot:1705283-Pleurochrysis_carterae.AAC.1